MSDAVLNTWPEGERFSTLGSRLLDKLYDEPTLYAVQQGDQVAGWTPVGGACHDNADAWVATHVGDKVVRGWLYQRVDRLPEGDQHVFVAHSVVRTSYGALVDVTLSRLDPVGRFLQHPEGVGGFFGFLVSATSASEFKILEKRRGA